ncbi:glycoside hydrolase family 5 protein [Caldimonas caldifontis]|uniref:Endoglucanase n=1 Tax=Caldimonas caldifontis TaxID=1452508 RepID=A0A2S5SQG3_9BURK|nr:glycoside hydrolase family 5 protein [Caldimonas caldifontis]PPE64981.1 endoglucanase [Caldimonas caldifontis]
MKPFLYRAAALAALGWALAAPPAWGCSFDQAPQARAESCNRLLARSINFGNMLEHAREGLAGPMLRDEFITLSAQAGFTAIRLPIRWDARAFLKPPYTISTEFFERVDGVIRLAQAQGLAVILDMHHYAGMMLEPQTERERFLALWRQVAEHYRDAPATVMFELLNEPHRELTRARWNEALAAVLPVVRESNPHRTLIIGGGDWNAADALADLRLPRDDRNIIATFHYYEPMAVTHQGAEWVSGAGDWVGTTWRGTAAERAKLRADFDRVQAWARAERRPIFLGEFGVYSRADEATRIAWTTAVRREAEARGFSWAYWELASSFGVLEPLTLTWRRPLLEALLPSAPVSPAPPGTYPGYRDETVTQR